MEKNGHKLMAAFWLVVFSIILSASCWADDTKPVEPASAASSSDYIIGSGDILEILVWKEEDLSRDVMVRVDGKITVPLLDDISAAGKTPIQLKQEIQTGLENFIEGPAVTVTLKSSGSQKFYILGEVAKTGEYTLTKSLTALQAFALAGGFTEWAQKNEIIVFRKQDGKDQTLRIDYKEIVKGKAQDDIVIQANDTIIVP
jgi:polysaccharide biosynthesis/export protein